jgi:hypothetical protein
VPFIGVVDAWTVPSLEIRTSLRIGQALILDRNLGSSAHTLRRLEGGLVPIPRVRRKQDFLLNLDQIIISEILAILICFEIKHRWNKTWSRSDQNRLNDETSSLSVKKMLPWLKQCPRLAGSLLKLSKQYNFFLIRGSAPASASIDAYGYFY